MLRTYEYVPLHGKKGFVATIKLRIFRKRDYPGLSRWVQCNHRVIITGWRDVLQRWRKGLSQETQKLLEARKGKGTENLQKEHSSAKNLILDFWTGEL